MADLHGGKRKGGGRPKGSRPRLYMRDHFTDVEIKKLVANAKMLAFNGDREMIKFLTDHIYGRPAQSMDLTTGGDKLNTMSYEQARETIREREGRRGTKGNGTE